MAQLTLTVEIQDSNKPIDVVISRLLYRLNTLRGVKVLKARLRVRICGESSGFAKWEIY